MNYDLIKLALSEIRKEIKKISNRKIAVTSTMHCCGSCHGAELSAKGYEAFLSAKIFKSGMNKNFDSISRWNDLCFNWELNDEELNLVIEILSKYFEVEKPASPYECIIIKNKNIGEEVACG